MHALLCKNMCRSCAGFFAGKELFENTVLEGSEYYGKSSVRPGEGVADSSIWRTYHV